VTEADAEHIAAARAVAQQYAAVVTDSTPAWSALSASRATMIAKIGQCDRSVAEKGTKRAERSIAARSS